ncbi:MAG: hypothetical protein LBS36_10005 [Oscillospiraceae bacterium]|jgi:hypothetical protein|nr:hypothetical protein [Oscillospiraceae bacterium]
MENKEKAAVEHVCYDLILAVVNQGFSEEIVRAAQPKGAKGGTVLHVRRVANEDFVKFFGISVQEDREIVALLADRAEKKAVMQTILSSFGVKTEARGLVFSLPVDDIDSAVLSGR